MPGLVRRPEGAGKVVRGVLAHGAGTALPNGAARVGQVGGPLTDVRAQQRARHGLIGLNAKRRLEVLLDEAGPVIELDPVSETLVDVLLVDAAVADDAVPTEDTEAGLD